MLSLTSGSELRRFRRGRLPRLAVAAMLLVPLLYGALYLWAFWSPTSHLDRLPVALVNSDTGATRTDGTQLTAGADLTDQLTDAKALDWHLTDPADAAAGVRDGDYYFAVTIPDDFSSLARLGRRRLPHERADRRHLQRRELVHRDDARALRDDAGARRRRRDRGRAGGRRGARRARLGARRAGQGVRRRALAARRDRRSSATERPRWPRARSRRATEPRHWRAARPRSSPARPTSPTGARPWPTAPVASPRAPRRRASRARPSPTARSRSPTACTRRVGTVDGLTSGLTQVGAYLTGTGRRGRRRRGRSAGRARRARTRPACRRSCTSSTPVRPRWRPARRRCGTGSGPWPTARRRCPPERPRSPTEPHRWRTARRTPPTEQRRWPAGTTHARRRRSPAGVRHHAGARTARSSSRTACPPVPRRSPTTRRTSGRPARATIANPVTLETTDLATAHSLGEGFAPMFLPMALFVGGIIIWLLLRPLPTRALATPASGWRVAIAGLPAGRRHRCRSGGLPARRRRLRPRPEHRAPRRHDRVPRARHRQRSWPSSRCSSRCSGRPPARSR